MGTVIIFAVTLVVKLLGAFREHGTPSSHQAKVISVRSRSRKDGCGKASSAGDFRFCGLGESHFSDPLVMTDGPKGQAHGLVDQLIIKTVSAAWATHDNE